MFSEVPWGICSLAAGCFVCSDSADVFWLSCPLCVLFKLFLFLLRWFWWHVEAVWTLCECEVPIVYCQQQHCFVCVCVCVFRLYVYAYSALASCYFHASFPCMQTGTGYQQQITVKSPEIVCVTVCVNNDVVELGSWKGGCAVKSRPLPSSSPC